MIIANAIGLAFAVAALVIGTWSLLTARRGAKQAKARLARLRTEITPEQEARYRADIQRAIREGRTRPADRFTVRRGDDHGTHA